jgi:hypothetical protein
MRIMPAMSCQVFASGTGNRRHPLFFLESIRTWLCGGKGVRQPRASSELQLPTIKSSSVVSTSSMLRVAATSSAAGACRCLPRLVLWQSSPLQYSVYGVDA